MGVEEGQVGVEEKRARWVLKRAKVLKRRGPGGC